ncbi:non-hydrolyzing UDP-N-acetylglucosamine 2-epimerase [uncultured Jatrophihabitans sp.]|uniref:non-hydrolyzing UDP-N-acetylglucosamine 2-epimerase n=1 Tax=uncultured Jatrophihabitans sp. TaxID=1610747 RepID=UPI0035C9CE64
MTARCPNSLLSESIHQTACKPPFRATVLVGTRPEAIKMAPVARDLRAVGVDTRVLATGQHRDLVAELLPALGTPADRDLDLMCEAQTLPALTARVIEAVAEDLAEHRPGVLLVQGDTTTAFAGALAACYARIPVAHVEAGLRSGSITDPFPEEANRQLLSRIATWHFAPTQRARAALELENLAPTAIEVTGNTVIDNLHWVTERGLGTSAFASQATGRRRVLVTMHRRENHGATIGALATAIGRLARRHDLEVVFPVHPNPAVRATVLPALGENAAVRLLDPLNYFDFSATLRDADLVLTDSGGVQEEAPSFGKPVLVLRNTTERPEAVEAGCARLIGTDPSVLESTVDLLLNDPGVYHDMSRIANPFGDGRAARRITQRLLADLVPGAVTERVA